MIPSDTAQRRALRALSRPSRRWPKADLGDGPTCPLTPRHGATYILRGSGAAYCPHSSHSGVTRATWRLDAEGRIVA